MVEFLYKTGIWTKDHEEATERNEDKLTQKYTERHRVVENGKQ